MVGFPHVYPEIDQSLHLITIASYDSLRQGRYYRLLDCLSKLRLAVYVEKMYVEDLEEIGVVHLFNSWKAPAGTKNSSTGGVFHEVGCPAGGTPYSHGCRWPIAGTEKSRARLRQPARVPTVWMCVCNI